MPTPALEHATSRGLEELRGVLVELVEEGSALGLTAAELFLQFGDRACTDGIGRRELRDGLASLSIHLTEAEVDTLLAGAGCTGEDEVSSEGSQLLTLEKFSAMAEKATVTTSPPGVAGSTAAAPSSAAVDHDQQPPPSAEMSEVTRINRDDSKERRAAEDDDGCVTPDSLAPRMSLSELLLDVQQGGGSAGGDGDGDGPGTSSSAAAHVEAFGRVAANVQAVLATAISRSGTRNDDGGGSGGGNSCGFGGHRQDRPNITGNHNERSTTDITNVRSSRMSASDHSSGLATQMPASRSRDGAAGAEQTSNEDKDREKEHRAAPGQDAAGQTPPSTRVSTSASRSGPVPRTGAITPPIGSARSPSEPLHPTRASRERLEAALEGLDLKERLRPTVSLGVGGQGGDGSDDADDGDSNGDGNGGDDYGARRSSRRSAGARSPAGSGLSRRLGSVDVGGGTDISGGGRRVSAIRARMVAGVDERGARVSRLPRKAGGRARVEQRRRLGEVVDLVAVERGDRDLGGSEEAPEVIGRLRARVAELELSEQLLRCELEGARADLVSKGRQAREDVQRELGRAKERERTLQAKMGARLRAAEAEAAAAEKRMAEFKRTSAAEAAAREKSSAEYLRRRLKEAEVTLEAKTARRSSLQSKQQRQHHQVFPTSRRRQGWRRESWGEENGTDSPRGSPSGGAGGGGRGTSGRWARPRARRRTELSGGNDTDGNDDESTAVAMARLREELASCRKQLAEVTEEASSLRKWARRPEKDDPSREPQRLTGKKVAGDVVGGAGRRASRPRKACVVCGDNNRNSRERQRERERRLEARIAESEEARIEVEAEAGRLQAFLDEMRGLGPLFRHSRQGGWNEAAAE
eukprot:g9430.t1